jgi:hypothetical protein
MTYQEPPHLEMSEKFSFLGIGSSWDTKVHLASRWDDSMCHKYVVACQGIRLRLDFWYTFAGHASSPAVSCFPHYRGFLLGELPHIICTRISLVLFRKPNLSQLVSGMILEVVSASGILELVICQLDGNKDSMTGGW